ncbi:MAG: 6-carboxytetrahydropterin synthase [Phycisphaerales bacterium]|nr:6-carboxytetrahydropterin synthase [Phycisphaerales bacterium]
MFSLQLQAVFSAAHAILIRGVREPLHGHDWHVTVTLSGHALDADGLLLDFHDVQHHLAEVIRPFHNANLNACEPFRSGLNPTAEHVARHICDALSVRLQTSTPDKPKTSSRRRRASAAPVAPVVWVESVRVTEAVGCAAVYTPARSDAVSPRAAGRAAVRNR